MHAFIGTVPFTLIEAINYVISYEIKDADLYFVTVFDGASEMGERYGKLIYLEMCIWWKTYC